ncbi:hypothetical protein ANN_11498 [Periplaneta americana]|uniref:Uncharacterized protein n=1 Tax=Periplaneta americana TaxID=6978 RepID=A0ABQ8T563_PERAM|nr:hypothetical protein ANN_11498 [Periplaneta americana]
MQREDGEYKEQAENTRRIREMQREQGEYKENKEDKKSIVACLLFTANTAYHVHVLEWHKRFREGRVSLQDDARPGQAHRAITPAVIAEVDGLIQGNRRITVEELRRLVGISHGSVHVIATKHLHYRTICAQWVQYQLTEEQKTNNGCNDATRKSMHFCPVLSLGTNRGVTILNRRANGRAKNENAWILPHRRSPKQYSHVPMFEMGRACSTYGCETLTLTLREEQRLMVFDNKMLRKMFGAKRDEVTGQWRKLHNAELQALRLKWAGHVSHMDESRNAYRVFVGRPEGKRRLGRPRRRWEDNIKMDLREVGYDVGEWINLARDRDR